MLSERTFGSFCRSLNVPSSVTPDQIKASLTDGILQIILHKFKPNRHAHQKIAIS
ncbi:hypothetical protein VP01_1958g3 [Puccinia sorghi]|uniref:SHSP domain-containing protein n=1 Tax=Puccinia sorghi TaxID=27349 RepID=A0A0L6VC53_9BASI|nr:hypothetical protein VP01_1958g3 [Puccinia sorghi]